jgi:hypothetical protein
MRLWKLDSLWVCGCHIVAEIKSSSQFATPELSASWVGSTLLTKQRTETKYLNIYIFHERLVQTDRFRMLVHLSVNFRRTLFQDEDEKIVGERITPT